ncbi:cytochrome c [Methylocystis iwaonis]|uniref:c-type cytochrome n=1 Tax=Methylocystis iwaonis TaxID=2885079 RepID=UPI002E7AE18B|nr:cytochrome c [Methylocystis iwaonis]
MRPLIFAFAAIASLLGGVVPGVGQESNPPDADARIAGHKFALQVCAACHVAAKDQTTRPILKPPAPSFLRIMRRPSVTEAFLRGFLRTPHGKMPNPELADFQIDEVVAYMLSLEQKK